MTFFRARRNVLQKSNHLPHPGCWISLFREGGGPRMSLEQL